MQIDFSDFMLTKIDRQVPLLGGGSQSDWIAAQSFGYPKHMAAAAEVRGRAIGRIRMRRIRDSSAESLLPFVQEAILPGSGIVTDGLPTYLGLPGLGYRHERKVIRGSDDPAHVAMPRVHRVASLLDRWWLGTYQGAIRREHLDYYLDEFTFRFNRRTSRSRGKLFYRLLQQAVAITPLPYQALVSGRRDNNRS